MCRFAKAWSTGHGSVNSKLFRMTSIHNTSGMAFWGLWWQFYHGTQEFRMYTDDVRQLGTIKKFLIECWDLCFKEIELITMCWTSTRCFTNISLNPAGRATVGSHYYPHLYVKKWGLEKLIAQGPSRSRIKPWWRQPWSQCCHPSLSHTDRVALTEGGRDRKGSMFSWCCQSVSDRHTLRSFD